MRQGSLTSQRPWVGHVPPVGNTFILWLVVCLDFGRGAWVQVPANVLLWVRTRMSIRVMWDLEVATGVATFVPCSKCRFRLRFTNPLWSRILYLDLHCKSVLFTIQTCTFYISFQSFAKQGISRRIKPPYVRVSQEKWVWIIFSTTSSFKHVRHMHPTSKH